MKRRLRNRSVEHSLKEKLKRSRISGDKPEDQEELEIYQLMNNAPNLKKKVVLKNYFNPKQFSYRKPEEMIIPSDFVEKLYLRLRNTYRILDENDYQRELS